LLSKISLTNGGFGFSWGNIKMLLAQFLNDFGSRHFDILNLKTVLKHYHLASEHYFWLNL